MAEVRIETAVQTLQIRMKQWPSSSLGTCATCCGSARGRTVHRRTQRKWRSKTSEKFIRTASQAHAHARAAYRCRAPSETARARQLRPQWTVQLA